MSDFDYGGLLPAPAAADDSRSAVERALLYYPRTWADFDKAEAQGFFVPRLHHLVYPVILSLVFVLARRVFTWYVLRNCIAAFGARFRRRTRHTLN